jgi:type VI secretion system secreted protein VgrG
MPSHQRRITNEETVEETSMDDDRVKIHFPWNRDDDGGDPVDDTSSCWIRVTQTHTSSFAPEVEDEVLVPFEQGDIHHPYILGGLWNSGDVPPSGLPGGQVVSGMKSNTTTGGGSNEYVMDDTAGNELIRVHGQYDMGSTVDNDETITNHGNHTETVGANHSETIGAAMELTVGAAMSETVSTVEVEEVSGTDGDWFIA